MSATKKLITPGYHQTLWDSAVLSTAPNMQAALDLAVLSVKRRKELYQNVEDEIGVPWKLTAGIDMRECSFRSNLGLHCGQPFNRPTTLPPVGKGPFRTWEEAAIDALKSKNLHLVSHWNTAKILEMAERYNGLGYLMHHPNVPSPYLWSGTNHYKIGKYDHDGFDPNLKDKQPGIAALLLKLKAEGL